MNIDVSRTNKCLTLATFFTLSRIILTPFVVWALVKQYWFTAFVVFVVAALTDGVDGAIARACGQQTFLGACLDPIADKILLLATFFTLALVPTPFFRIPLWFVWFVLVKELLILGGAGIIWMRRGSIRIAPTWLSKATTCVQIGFVTWLFLCYFFGWLPVKTYHTMLVLLIGIVLLTLVQYAYIGLRQLKK